MRLNFNCKFVYFKEIATNEIKLGGNSQKNERRRPRARRPIGPQREGKLQSPTWRTLLYSQRKLHWRSKEVRNTQWGRASKEVQFG